jgi:hypothetical protein
MNLRVDAKPFLPRQLHETGPFLFWKDGPGETRDGMVWFITTCGNPMCSCRDATVDIYNTDDRLMFVDLLDDGVRQHIKPVEGRAPCPDRHARIFVDVDGGDIEADSKEKPDAGLVQWARQQIDGPLLALLQRRLASAKKHGSADLVLDFDPQVWSPGDFLPHLVVHPTGDVTIEHDGDRYLVDDQHCVEPGCDCGTVIVDFHLIHEETKSSTRIGTAWLDLDGSRPLELEPAEPADAARLQAVHDAFRSGPAGTDANLADRHRRMHALGREIHRRAKPPPPAAKVGRNDPCPCGSGKKYKKCCLRKAA